MTAPRRGLLDTSIFIAGETGRVLNEAAIPDESAVSVITVAELHVGVLAARDVDARARRLAAVGAIGDVQVLAVDEPVATAWARLRVHLAELGRGINVNDLWIAATAVAHGIPVVTQDDDFDAVDGLGGLSVIRA